MAFQPDPMIIRWRLHLGSPPQRVYEMLATDTGRASFWAESAIEDDGVIVFEFVNGMKTRAEVIDREEASRFEIRYFGTNVAFELDDDGVGGTDLTLKVSGFEPADREEWLAGWLNVLFPLKAAVDHGIDLRNHDSGRTWEDGYADQ